MDRSNLHVTGYEVDCQHPGSPFLPKPVHGRSAQVPSPMIHPHRFLVSALLLVLAALPAAGQSSLPSKSDATRLPNLAVMRLESSRLDTSDLEVLRDALTVELQNSGRVRVMERSQMNAILSEQGFQKTGSCDASECAVEVGRILAVDRMVLGSAGKLGETWSVTLRLVNVETGEVAASVRDSRSGSIEVLLSQSVPKLAADLVASIATPASANSREGDFALATLLVRDRAFLRDSGKTTLQRVSRNFSAAQVLQLDDEGSMSRSWVWANLYPFVPVGSAFQRDWKGLGWIALAWTPGLVANATGADNKAIFLLLGYGFQVGRPLWYTKHHNTRLRQGLNLAQNTLVPTPTLQQLADGSLVPTLSWSF